MFAGRCLLHFTRTHAKRRGLWQSRWYKKFEPKFVGALSVRLQMILIGESIPGPAVLGGLLPVRVGHHAKAIIEIATHIEKRYADESRSRSETEER
jgi:hypothetical protein